MGVEGNLELLKASGREVMMQQQLVVVYAAAASWTKCWTLVEACWTCWRVVTTCGSRLLLVVRVSYRLGLLLALEAKELLLMRWARCRGVGDEVVDVGTDRGRREEVVTSWTRVRTSWQPRGSNGFDRNRHMWKQSDGQQHE